MNLKVLLPFRIFLDLKRVSRIVAETREGSFGLLPHRLDCVAALVPGILAYTLGDDIAYLAVDQGVLVKSGADVMVSVRQAIQGTTLSELHETVKREYLSLDRQERDVRAAVARMESALLGRFAEFQHGR
jgi:F-type H+-transporting ATPase subunit epsilon